MTQEQLLERIAMLEANQQGLIQENNRLHQQSQKGAATEKLIYRKMLAVKKALGAIGKDQKNSGQGFMFRGIDQFQNALKPILDEHGVGITVETINYAEAKFIEGKDNKKTKNVAVVMKYTFFAEDGSMLACTVPAEGVDSGDKGTNKALSAAFKYCMIQTFCVPTEDQAEGDKDSPSVNGEASRKYKTTPVEATTGTNTLTSPNTSGTVTVEAIVKTAPANSTIVTDGAGAVKPGTRFRKAAVTAKADL